MSELKFERQEPFALKIFNFLGEIGLGSPTARVMVGFIIGSGLSWLFHSSAMFDENGQRPFALISSDSTRATYIPWFFPGIVLAILFGIFI